MMHRWQYSLYLITAMFFLVFPGSAHGQPARFKAADSEGVQAHREGNTLYLKIDAEVKGPITIPRLAAPLRSIAWEGGDAGGSDLKPLLQSWQINWKHRPAGAKRLVLAFDAPPVLISEVRPIAASGDGSFYLPAHLATTRGEKIRYEPQPNKNTVGFWVGKTDSAAWTIKLDKPGRFNVAVLQGCGKHQGGSSAVISFVSPVKDLTPTLKFKVLETGHFQNFKWVQLGEVQLRHAGKVEVSVAPEQIKKAALMDIRAIHLIRLPDKR